MRTAIRQLHPEFDLPEPRRAATLPVGDAAAAIRHAARMGAIVCPASAGAGMSTALTSRASFSIPRVSEAC